MVNNAKRESWGMRRAAAMPCRVTTPADPNGSSWDSVDVIGLWWKRKDWTLSCSKEDREDIIIESQRIRITKSTNRNSWGPHRGPKSCFPCRTATRCTKPISTPKAVTIPAARVAMDQDWGKWRINKYLCVASWWTHQYPWLVEHRMIFYHNWKRPSAPDHCWISPSKGRCGHLGREGWTHPGRQGARGFDRRGVLDEESERPIVTLALRMPNWWMWLR